MELILIRIIFDVTRDFVFKWTKKSFTYDVTLLNQNKSEGVTLTYHLNKLLLKNSLHETKTITVCISCNLDFDFLTRDFKFNWVERTLKRKKEKSISVISSDDIIVLKNKCFFNEPLVTWFHEFIIPQAICTFNGKSSVMNNKKDFFD